MYDKRKPKGSYFSKFDCKVSDFLRIDKIFCYFFA